MLSTMVRKRPAGTPKPKPPSYTPAEIRAIRTRLGLTQEEAAQRVGVGQGVWASWESGKRKPARQSALLIKLLSSGKI